MKYLDLSREGNVFILTMINGEQDNTFTTDVLKEYNTLLDEIEGSEGNASLIITSNHHKTWSTGINLEWLLNQSPEDALHFSVELKRMLLRISLLNLPTVACITGNCYAGAAIMASGMDFRLMRADRGRFCFPEVNIKIPFGQTLTEIIRLLPNHHALNELALTGAAWGGVECLPKNVVDAIYSAEQLPGKARELAKALAEKDRVTYTTIKRELRKRLMEIQISGTID